MSHSYMTCMDENCEIAPCVDRRMAEHQKSKLQVRVKELEDNLRSARNKNEDMDHAYGLLQARVKELEAEVSELKDPMWKVPCNGDGEPCPPAILKEREELHGRVEALIEIQRAYQEAFDRIKTENARLVAESALKSTLIDDLGKHVSRLSKVVEAARNYKRLDEHSDECVCPVCSSLRELDGEKITKAVCAHEFEGAIDPTRPSWCSKCGTEG